MGPRVNRVIGWALNALHVKRHPELFQPPFIDQQDRTDTVVFVHGLHGSFDGTWGRFPRLVRDDPDLPLLDVWPWSYRASILPGAHSIVVQAQHLITGLRTLPDSVDHLFLVGHSMGGLVVLEGLCQELRGGRANERPIDAIRHVTLYATPVKGSQLASAFSIAMKRLGRLGRLFSPQLEELRKDGDFSHTLLEEMADRLYHPRIDAGSLNHKRNVPITACVASEDLAVNPESVIQIFHTPPAHRFPGGHSAIKEPESRTDLRYRAFQQPLAEHYARWFSERAAAAQNDATGGWALLELETRCLPALRTRLKAHPTLGFDTLPAAQQRRMIRRFLCLAIELATARPNLEFGYVLNLSFQAFAELEG